jgi:hypothetical protein
MPGGDRTGPTGMGSKTGRGMGFCAGLDVPGVINRGFGFFGRGRQGQGGGGRRGRRNRFYATGLTGWQQATMDASAQAAATAAPTTETEKQFLEAQVGVMQSQLEEIKKRLAAIEAEAK